MDVIYHGLFHYPVNLTCFFMLLVVTLLLCNLEMLSSRSVEREPRGGRLGVAAEVPQGPSVPVSLGLCPGCRGILCRSGTQGL